MYQAAIFDLDGTLLDTLDDIQFALNAALAEHGHPTHDREAVRRMVGHGLGELVKQGLPAHGADDYDTVLARLRHLYLDTPVRNTRPYPGIPELLAELKARGIRLGILTNKAHPVAVKIVDHFFPGVFDAVQGEEVGLARKPNPAGVERLMGRMSCRGLETVFVGDSEADVHTAINAGLPCIAVSWGFRDEEVLRAAGAVNVVATADNLRFLIGLD